MKKEKKLNIEKYYDDIVKYKHDFAVNKKTGKVGECCKDIECMDCVFFVENHFRDSDQQESIVVDGYSDFYCKEELEDWLYSEYKNPKALSDVKEKEIIKNLTKVVKYTNKVKHEDIRVYKNSFSDAISIYDKGRRILTFECDNNHFVDLERDTYYTLKELGLDLSIKE